MAFFVTAVVAAVEVTTVLTVCTAIAEVGMALSVVGAVTGNKDLMKIGGVMGLVGGVGSLVSGALSAAEGAAALEAADASMTGSAFSEAGAGLTGAEGATLGAEQVSPDLSNWGSDAMASSNPGGYQGTGPAQWAPDPNAGASAAASASPAANTGALVSDTGATPLSGQQSRPLDGTPQASQAPGTQTPYGAGSSATNMSSIPAPGNVNEPGWFDKFMKGLTPDGKQRLMSGLLQTGGQMIGGLFQGWSEEQKLALEQHKQDLAEQHYQQEYQNRNNVIRINPTGLLSSTPVPKP